MDEVWPSTLTSILTPQISKTSFVVKARIYHYQSLAIILAGGGGRGDNGHSCDCFWQEQLGTGGGFVGGSCNVCGDGDEGGRGTAEAEVVQGWRRWALAAATATLRGVMMAFT
jgi:hypothetical protein